MLGLAVGDRHLAERDAVARPGEADARCLAHLGQGVRGGQQVHGSVEGDRGGGTESSRAWTAPSAVSRSVFGKPLDRASHGVDPGAELCMRGVGVRRVGAWEEDDHRHALGKALEQAPSDRAQPPDAEHQQQPSRRIARARRPRARPRRHSGPRGPRDSAGTDRPAPAPSRSTRRAPGEASRSCSGSTPSWRSSRTSRRATSAKPGVVATGSKYPVGLPGDFRRIRPLGHRRQRPPAVAHQRQLAEADAELSKRGEADVDEPGCRVGDAALQVRPLEHAADEDVDRGEATVALQVTNRPGGAPPRAPQARPSRIEGQDAQDFPEANAAGCKTLAVSMRALEVLATGAMFRPSLCGQQGRPCALLELRDTDDRARRASGCSS